MEKIISTPKILDEHYEVEFAEDPGMVYEPGDQKDAKEFIEDYCECNSPELDDVANRLRSIPIPEAVKFVAEMWAISYKLHQIKTIDQIIE